MSRITPPRAPAATSPRDWNAASEPAPPPRPPLARSDPPPIVRIEPPSALTRTARILWGLSALAGVLALVVTVLRRSDQFRRLRNLIEDVQPGYGTDTIDTAATVAFWGTVGLLVVFLAAELLLRARTERSAGSRWWMLLLLGVHSAAAAATVSFIALDAEGTSTKVLVIAQLAIAGAALLVTAIAALVSPPRPPAPGRERARPRR